jgi:hypothetical protein
LEANPYWVPALFIVGANTAVGTGFKPAPTIQCAAIVDDWVSAEMVSKYLDGKDLPKGIGKRTDINAWRTGNSLVRLVSRISFALLLVNRE